MTDEDDFDQFFIKTIEQMAAQKLRQTNPYVLQLIKVLWPYGARGLQRALVIERMDELRRASGVKIPRKKFEHAVQSAFNRHNGQSDLFKKGSYRPKTTCSTRLEARAQAFGPYTSTRSSHG